MGFVSKRCVWVCLLALCLGCGRSTLEPGWSWEDQGASGAAAQAGSGGRGVGGAASGGTNFGGSFTMTAGTAFGGSPSSGGVAGDTGGLCSLSKGDCRVAEPNCEEFTPACTGKLILAQAYGSERAAITDISASRDGPVAIAGYYSGLLALGDNAKSVAATSGIDAFVGWFDSAGVAQSTASLGTVGTQGVTGIAVMGNGNALVQGVWAEGVGPESEPSTGTGYVSEVSSAAFFSFTSFGDSNLTRPAGVAVDNNGAPFLVGTFTDSLTIQEQAVSCNGECGYLAKLDSDNNLSWLKVIEPFGTGDVRVTRVVADDEDNVIVIGEEVGEGRRAFFQKRSSNGQLVFSKELAASVHLELRALAVDRQMRITLGGAFSGTWQAGGFAFESSPNAVTDAWVAQYSSLGEPIWGKTYPSEGGKLASISAAAIDPYGNVVVAGVASYLDVAGETIDPVVRNMSNAAFVLKLRPDGRKVWLRGFYGSAQPELGLATDSAANIWLGGNFLGALEISGEVAVAPSFRHAFLFRLTP